MAVKVMIPTPLRSYTGNKDSVEVEGQTIDEVLLNLTEKYPQLKRHLFADDGRLRNFINIYVNDEDVRYLEKGDTKVKEGDIISIIPAIAGGKIKFETR